MLARRASNRFSETMTTEVRGVWRSGIGGSGVKEFILLKARLLSGRWPASPTRPPNVRDPHTSARASDAASAASFGVRTSTAPIHTRKILRFVCPAGHAVRKLNPNPPDRLRNLARRQQRLTPA